MDVYQKVDHFIEETVIRQNDSLLHALQTSREHHLPEWEVSPQQGQFLSILTKIRGAKRAYWNLVRLVATVPSGLAMH